MFSGEGGGGRLLYRNSFIFANFAHAKFREIKSSRIGKNYLYR